MFSFFSFQNLQEDYILGNFFVKRLEALRLWLFQIHKNDLWHLSLYLCDKFWLVMEQPVKGCNAWKSIILNNFLIWVMEDSGLAIFYAVQLFILC